MSVFDELKIDLLMAGNLSKEQTSLVVDWLRHEGILDYDILKEYYEDEEDE